MKTIEVNQIIDNARFTRFHWMVTLLCSNRLGREVAVAQAIRPAS